MNPPSDGGPIAISPDDSLYRRFFFQNKKKRDRVPLTAFTLRGSHAPDPEISVMLASLCSPEDVLQGQPAGLKICILSVRDVLGLGLQVRHSPLPGNPAHCSILGVSSLDMCDQLAEHATIYRPTVSA
jgi:hypothetical protein